MTLYYYSYDQSERFPLPDTTLLSDVIPILEDEWVPYLRCELCGRNDQCAYVEKYEDDNYVGFNEIKCGVVSKSLKGVIELSESQFTSLNPDERQKFIDALYYLVQYVISSDTFISSIQKPKELVENYGLVVGFKIIGGVSRTRDYLNKACALLQSIPFVGSKRIMLLVEGASEAAFIERLLVRDSYLLHNVEVKSYDSESNKKYNVIRLLIQEYKSKGYHVLIQVDVDGKSENLNESNVWGLKEHVQKGLLAFDDIFSFSEDLESSYPKELLCESLSEMYDLEPARVYEAIFNPKSSKNTLYKRLLEDLGNMPSKPKLAKEIADLVSDYDLANDKNFADNELVKFIKFIEHRARKI
ncbi:TPA: hypothetical protein NJ358_000107 [Vibrio parahaemolyticus]|nr:hypothetical protein [Vibrio parahaemolyticus]